MKVLIFAPYFTIDGYNEFSRNKSGLGYMIWDIARMVVCDKHEIYLLTQSVITNQTVIDKVIICSRRWRDISFNIKFDYLAYILRAIRDKDLTITEKLRVLLYYLSGGYIEKCLKEIQPDLVHIHTIGNYSIPAWIACIKCGVKYLFTLHGLNSLNSSITVTSKAKKLEISFLELAAKKNLSVTVISTGIKNRITSNMNVNSGNNISIVTNGVDINRKGEKALNIKKKYRIPSDKKILLCVGNISKNKNQIQIIRAFALLPNNLKERLVLMLVGENTLGDELETAAKRLSISKSVVFCGAIPRKLIHNYYNVADYNVTAAISEGFGLSIIESLNFGVPTVCFSDLDAIPDVYDKRCMVMAEERTDNALALAIEILIKTSWDREYIKKYSEKFGLNWMAEKYISIYKDTINNNNFNISQSDITKLLY